MLLPEGIKEAKEQEDVRYGSKYEPLFKIWAEMDPKKWLLTWNYSSVGTAEYVRLNLGRLHEGQVRASRVPEDWFDIGPAMALGRPESSDEVKLLPFGDLEHKARTVAIGDKEIYYLIVDGLPWRPYAYLRKDLPNTWRRMRLFNIQGAKLDTWYEVDLEIFFANENGIWEDAKAWQRSVERLRAFTKVGFGVDDDHMIKTRFHRNSRKLRYLIEKRK